MRPRACEDWRFGTLADRLPPLIAILRLFLTFSRPWMPSGRSGLQRGRLGVSDGHARDRSGVARVTRASPQ